MDVLGSIVYPTDVYHPRRGNLIVFMLEINGVVSNLEKRLLNIGINNVLGKK